jgi:hypothetical protein
MIRSETKPGARGAGRGGRVRIARRGRCRKRALHVVGGQRPALRKTLVRAIQSIDAEGARTSSPSPGNVKRRPFHAGFKVTRACAGGPSAASPRPRSAWLTQLRKRPSKRVPARPGFGFATSTEQTRGRAHKGLRRGRSSGGRRVQGERCGGSRRAGESIEGGRWEPGQIPGSLLLQSRGIGVRSQCYRPFAMGARLSSRRGRLEPDVT